MRLPEMVSMDIEAAKEMSEHLPDCLDGPAWRHTETLMASAAKLEALTTDFRLSVQAEAESSRAKYLAVKCQTLALKVQSLELEILASTYNAGSVAALKMVRKRLDEAVAKATKEVKESKSALSQYEAAGADFDETVKAYTTVRKEIDGKKWALSELGRTMANTG